jgi:nocardicin N-oxygenase
MVLCEILGIRHIEQSEHATVYRPMMNTILSNGYLSPEDAADAIKEALASTASIIEEKRANPADDVFSAMIHAHDEEGRLTDVELVNICLQLIIGGFQTVSSQIPLSILALLREPRQFRLLIERPDLMPGAVEELLRYVSVMTALLVRVPTRDIVLGGATIPAGSAVLPSSGAANKDPDVFAEPESLIVTRSIQQHAAFGHGTHYCIGASLARAELEIAIGTLIRRLPTLRLAVREEDLEWASALTVRTVRKLPVAW